MSDNRLTATNKNSGVITEDTLEANDTVLDELAETPETDLENTEESMALTLDDLFGETLEQFGEYAGETSHVDENSDLSEDEEWDEEFLVEDLGTLNMQQ
jgi:hypothetical protein